MAKKPTYEELEQKNLELEAKFKTHIKRIDELKTEKDKYKDQFTLFRQMIDNVPDLIWAKDMDDRYLMSNQANCEKLLKCSSTQEPVGKQHVFFAQRERESGQVHTFGESCEDTDQVIKKTQMPERFLEDGMVRDAYLALDVYKAPFYDDSGKMIGTVGCGRDVARELEINNALKDSEKRFREIIEDVTEISIQGYNEKRKVIFWNRASQELYGYTEAEALGEKLEDLIIPEPMRETVKQLHVQWLEAGTKIPPGELVLVDKSGRPVPVFSSHIMYETGKGKEMFCIDIDLSPIKEAQKEKKRLQDQLRQAQKMEAIGTLAGGIAHDFNNILVPILGYTEILLQETDQENVETKENLNYIHSSATRAKELVQQILAFSRQETTTYKPVKIQKIINEVITLLRATLPSNIEIKTYISPDCQAVYADATQVHQIVINLATNAYHAMGDDGGKLEVHLNEVDLDVEQAGKLDIKPGPAVSLVVSDTGKGMSKDLVEKIFDPFFTTKEKGKGTGMGLSVVHGIVKNMKAGISVVSQPGQGTDFNVCFPLEKGLKTQTQPETINGVFSKGTECILLVDDEIAVLKVVEHALEMFGYQVKTAINPDDALDMFSNTPDAFDLVLTDMSMPSMSGDQLVSKLLKIRPDIPVILCTGFSEKMTPAKAKEIGIKSIVMKPVVLKDLSVKIRTVLDAAGQGEPKS